MADEHDDDVLELTDPLPEDEQPDASEAFHIEIQGEEPDAEATPLVRQLREQLRERNRQIAAGNREPEKVEVGPKPKLADFDYDEDKHEAAVDAWYANRDKARQSEATIERQREEAAKADQRYATAYATNRAKLPVSDFDAAEATVRAALSDHQKALVLRYAGDSAKVVYALAKYPAKLDALAATEDPGDFIVAVRDMEAKLTVGSHKPKPPRPEMETVQSGSAPLSARAGDERMKALEKEAEKSGDYSKLFAARRAARKAVDK